MSIPIRLGVWLKQWLKQEHRILLVSLTVGSCTILLRLTGFFQSFELAAFDQLARLRPREPMDKRILIVEIDEDDIQAAGQWPLSDRTLAQLLVKINAAQPRAVGLDIYRDLPVEPGYEDLVAAVKNQRNLVAIERLEDKNTRGVAPPPMLPPQQIGFNNVLIDADGKVRRGLLYWHHDDQLHTSFALRLALLYLQQQDIVPTPAEINSDYLQLHRAVFRPFQSNDGGYIRADAQGYQILGNFIRPSRFEKVTMGEVLADRVPIHQIRDRVVVIGYTAPSLKDFAYISYSTDWLGNAEPIYGVELHANFLSQILRAVLDGRSPIQTWPEWLEWLWIAAWSGVGGTIVYRGRSPLRSSTLVLVAVASLCGIAYFNFLRGWWIPLIVPLCGFSGTTALLTNYLAHQREELKRSKEFLQSLIDKIPDPIFVKDKQHCWILLNQAFCQFSGYPLEKLLGQSDPDIFKPQEAEVFLREDRLVFATGEARENEEAFTDADGNTYLIATKRSLHQDAAGNLFLVGVIRDITERKRIEEDLRRTTAELARSNEELQLSQTHLRRLAYHDDLTGLANRKHFHDSLDKALAWGKEKNKLVGLLFLDLDGFKQVNDTLGHDFGDLLLKAVAGRVKNCLRSSDVVARLGGDEFTVILPGIAHPDRTETVADKIRHTLSRPFMIEGHSIQVSASIGSSVYPDDGETQDVLIKKADQAMYHSKHLGRK